MRALTIFFLFLTCFFIPPSTFAQSVTRDSAELVAFLDGLMEAHMTDQHIAGATVAIVRDGRLFLTKGYGFADLDVQQPVDPERTMFRIGSISKLFTWTAVMQQVQAGKLDLNVDINTYLKDFQIPPTYEEPVTLKHLMTHSAGFEDRVIGLFAKTTDRLRPLGEILADELPARVRPPGEVSSYSNHGTGMAAYIVEQVSGTDFNDYVEQHILNPLQMQHTTFRQPLPDELAPDMSRGYAWEGGELKEKEFEYVPLAPVGAAATTATDMARFMLAHLQLGTYDGATILDTATTRLMHSEAFHHAPQVNPMAYGFYEVSRNGQRIIAHGGDTFWFHSQLALFPESGLGIFLSFNSAGGGGTSGDVLEALVDYLFPYEAPTDQLDPDPGALERFAGAYRVNRFAHTTMAKMAALMATVELSVTDDGRLKTATSEETAYWVPEGPLTFREEHGQDRLVFRENEEGKITHAFLSDVPILALEPVPPSESPGLHGAILAGAVVIFLLTITGWATGALLRRRYGVRAAGQNLLPGSSRWAGWVMALVFILYYVGLTVVMSDPIQIAFGIPAGLRIVQLIPFVALVLTLVVLFQAFRIWAQGYGRLRARLYYSLLGVSGVLALWQLYEWNLFGFHFG